jgi:hypothetical protein
MDLVGPLSLLRSTSMEGMDEEAASGPRFPPYLRLVWSNPTPPPPRRPMNLATAIERQMAGHFGLTNEQFATLFAKG